MAEDRAQVLGYLGSSVEHEGGGVWGSGVDDAQFGVFRVEAEHELGVAPLDAEAQGLEIQRFTRLPLRHVVHLRSPAPSGGPSSLDPTRGELAPC